MSSIAERYDKRRPGPWSCTRCQAGDCENCIDVLRVVYGFGEICKCKRKKHSGEPFQNQIEDPETGTVYGPNVEVSKDGEVKFVASITCPKCGMTSHNPNDIEQMYCGNCHQYHAMMEL